MIKTVSDIPLLLFAKAPIAGKVKTRLQSHCSPEQAATIAEILLEESIVKATQAWPGEVFISVGLDIDHAFLQKMARQYPIKLTMQCDGDLGDRMYAAFQQYGYPAAIMGCDAPHILADDLSKAYELLKSGSAVLGPSDDGGYYFIGLTNQHKSIFYNIEWGTSTVLATTQDLAKQTGLAFSMLAGLNDVDEWEDVISVAKKLPRLASFLAELDGAQ